MKVKSETMYLLKKYFNKKENEIQLDDILKKLASIKSIKDQYFGLLFENINGKQYIQIYDTDYAEPNHCLIMWEMGFNLSEQNEICKDNVLGLFRFYEEIEATKEKDRKACESLDGKELEAYWKKMDDRETVYFNI